MYSCNVSPHKILVKLSTGDKIYIRLTKSYQLS